MRRTHAGASERRAPSRVDGSGPSTERRGVGQCREYLNLVDPLSGKDVCIKASELGDVDLGPRRVLAGDVSGSRAFYVVSALGLFSEGRELEIMLHEYREAGHIPKEEPPESSNAGPREYVMMTSSTLSVVCAECILAMLVIVSDRQK